MAAESNTGFHYDGMLVSAMNRHMSSFQSINSTSEMIPFGSYFGMNKDTSGMIFSGNSNTISNSGMSQAGSSSGGCHILDYGSDLKNDAGLAAEWSFEEHFKLEEGLVNFAAEPSIMKYVKIAATLRDKTVRDVAMRCRWMARKRRKQEEHNAGWKSTNRKDKLVETSSKTNLTSNPLINMPAYSLTMHNMDQNKCMPYEALSCTSKHLLEQNFRLFNQITANLSTFKLQDNIDLLSCTRNNITAILDDMRDMPGIMSLMPPLPVTINEDLADSILSNMSKTLIFGLPRGFQLKEEPRCG